MIDLNCQGMPCPLPLLKLKVALHEAADAAQICLTATDAISQRDIPAFIERTAHHLIEQTTDGTVYRFIVQKSG
ncbi:MAG: sulfurtransferase TusA family protein [Gammaproteobacteria bacterium]|nr:sulfurtransferase TusA family protein [Gammaproteobacteria bacterium]